MEERSLFSEYRVLTDPTEIPRVFNLWCSLSLISSVLGRSVWIEMGSFRIYPNMFVILIAGSGRMRKSTAIGIPRGLLTLMESSPNMIAQKITAEALMDAMRVAPRMDAKTINLGAPRGQGFVITDELTNFLNGKTIEGGISPMLIDFYDNVDKFKYQTKARGEEILVDTQLNVLAATTPEELKRAIPEESIGSGLASRILFIYEDRPNAPIAFPEYNQRQLDAKEFVVRALNRLPMIQGPITLDVDIREWLKDFYEKRCWNSRLLEDPHLRGYASRRYIHLFKIAINLTVGIHESLKITEKILNMAELLLEANEANLPKIVQLVTMNEKGTVTSTVLGIIAKAGVTGLTRQVLMKAMSHRIDSRELVEIIDTLTKSNQIRTVVNGSSIVYTII